MIHNMGGVIAMLATVSGGESGQFRITRGPTFTDDGHGNMVPDPNPPSFLATGSVQPISPKRVRELPEGAHSADWRTVYLKTDEPITTTDVQAQRRGHTITVGGLDYWFIEVNDWRADGGFVRGLVQRVAL